MAHAPQHSLGSISAQVLNSAVYEWQMTLKMYRRWNSKKTTFSFVNVSAKVQIQLNKIDKLDVTCFIISLFTVQHVSNVNATIFRSLRFIVELFHVLYCSGSMCVGFTVWLGWGGVVSLWRLKQSFSQHEDTTPPQTYHTVKPTHIEPEQYNTWKKSTINRKLLKKDVLTFEACWAVNSEIIKPSDIKLVYLYSTIKMVHGPIKLRFKFRYRYCWLYWSNLKQQYCHLVRFSLQRPLHVYHIVCVFKSV
jgi:hypothetical protein